MVWRLTDDPTLFPDPYYGDEDGLIAVGGDLSPERLVNAYSNGIFPWYGFKDLTKSLKVAARPKADTTRKEHG